MRATSPTKFETFAEYLQQMNHAKVSIITIVQLQHHYWALNYIAGNYARVEKSYFTESITDIPTDDKWKQLKAYWESLKSAQSNAITKLAEELEDIEEKSKFPQYGKKVDPDLIEEQTKMPFSGKSCSFTDPEKLNLCELLKNQIGIELYCTAYGTATVHTVKPDVVLVKVGSATNSTIVASFNSKGSLHSFTDGECILFPSKDQRDWSKFNPCQFKDGERVWVKRYHSEVWNALYHSGTMTENNKHIVHECQKKNGKLIEVEDCRPFSEIPF